MQSSRVQCIALLGRISAPLYLRAVAATAGDASEIKWYFLAHSALDVMEDRASRGTNPYLGLLTTLEDTAIYGFQTNTHIKILLMLQLRDDPLSDVDVVTMFKAIHAAYIAYISNPFAHTLPGELPGATDADDTPVRPAAPPNMDNASRPIWSAAFERRIDAIAGWRPANAEPSEAA